MMLELAVAPTQTEQIVSNAETTVIQLVCVDVCRAHDQRCNPINVCQTLIHY